MTVIFDPGHAAPEGPFVANRGDGGEDQAGATEAKTEAREDDMKAAAVEAAAVDGAVASRSAEAAGAEMAAGAELAAEAAGAAMLRAIGIAESLFTKAAGDFDDLSGRVLMGEMGEVKEAVGQARALRAAAQTMMDERNRVDKLRKEVGGGIGGAGSLDLDAARDEIGRRLACLRRAAGG